MTAKICHCRCKQLNVILWTIIVLLLVALAIAVHTDVRNSDSLDTCINSSNMLNCAQYDGPVRESCNMDTVQRQKSCILNSGREDSR